MALFLAVGVTVYQRAGRLMLILAGGEKAFVACSQSDTHPFWEDEDALDSAGRKVGGDTRGTSLSLGFGSVP